MNNFPVQVGPSAMETTSPEDEAWEAEMRAKLHPSIANIPVRVQNMVYTVQLNMPVNIVHLVSALVNMGVQWCPMRIAALIIRIRGMLTILLNRNGKVVCMGSRNPKLMRRGLDLFIAELDKKGYPGIAAGPAVVQNIVATSTIPGRPIDLHGLHERNQSIVNHSPFFPGAIIRHHDSRGVTSMVFRSGCVLIVGGKRLADARRSLLLALELVQPHIFALNGPPPVPSVGINTDPVLEGDAVDGPTLAGISEMLLPEVELSVGDSFLDVDHHQQNIDGSPISDIHHGQWPTMWDLFSV